MLFEAAKGGASDVHIQPYESRLVVCLRIDGIWEGEAPAEPSESFSLRERPGEGILLTQGRGCENCRETGYRGRVGVFELLMVDDPVRSKIQDRSIVSEIRDVTQSRGMRVCGMMVRPRFGRDSPRSRKSAA